MLSACKYFAKSSLKWIPGFGWGTWLMGNIMISRSWTTDQHKITQAFATLKAVKLPTWLISYPEGTRLNPQKLQSSQDYAKKKDEPVLQHVLLPRCKGFLATMGALRTSHLQAVYDLTIAYFHKPTQTLQKAPSIVRLHTGPLNQEYAMHVHVKRYDLNQLPSEEGALRDWLMQRFQEKDALLQRFHDKWLDGVTLVNQGQW